MTFREINDLRKNGQLAEAYAEGRASLQEAPNDIWNKRALSWCIYDYLRIYSEKADSEAVLEKLIELFGIGLPAEEIIFWDKIPYQLFKAINRTSSENMPNFSLMDFIFENREKLYHARPSEAHSVLLKAFLKYGQDWKHFGEFLTWWDLNNLREEDYQEGETQDKKKMISLAERVLIAISKFYLKSEEYAKKTLGISIIIDQTKEVNHLLGFMDKVIEKYPRLIYVPYYKGKLLIALGDRENALKEFIPFARKKRQEFWIWDIMSETFPQNDPKRFACLCKALSCSTQPHFLLQVKIKLIQVLIERENHSSAKTEMKEVIHICESQGWKLPYKLYEWQNLPWYQSAITEKDNLQLYQQYSPQAEEILFNDIKPSIGVVEFVNSDKKILYFVVNQEIHGNFKYSGYFEKPQVGDFLLLRLEKVTAQPEPYYKVLTCEKTFDLPSSDVYREFKGLMRLKDNFGFIDNVFIAPDLVIRYHLSDGNVYTGKALISFNKKKKEWAWKAISITS